MLLGHPIGEVDRHLSVDQTPVLSPSGPLFGNIHHSQIQHFEQTVIGGEDGFGLGHLAQLAVKSLNDVGGIDQPPDLLEILEVDAQVGPVVTPGLEDFGVYFLSQRSTKTFRASRAACSSTGDYPIICVNLLRGVE